MADGHGAVTVQQQHGHRLADDIRAADNDAFLAPGVDLVLVEQLHHACRGAGHEIEIADHDLADVDRMERIDVLPRVDGVDDGLLRDVLRHRHLTQDTRDLGAFVELRDQAEQLLLRGLLGQGVLFAVKAALLAGALLVAHIDLAGRVVADDNDRKAGRHALFLQLLGLREDTAAHLGGQRLAVHSYCTHAVSLLMMMIIRPCFRPFRAHKTPLLP